MNRAGGFASCLAVGLLAADLASGLSIVDSKHDMSLGSATTGPKATAGSGVNRICVFCHTPHAPGLNVPLWNQQVNPAQTYTFYSSSYLTGMGFTPPAANAEDGTLTELCLSCHDGVNAPGTVYNLGGAPGSIPMTGAMGAGPNLTTDLSDDHPILYSVDPGKDPGTRIPASGALVECVSCHEPHDNANGYFLREPMTGGTVCLQCHIKDDFAASAHATSTVPYTEAGAPATWTQVRHFGCTNCHRVHNVTVANTHLLRGSEENTCYTCHDGSLAGADDIQGAFAQANRHPTELVSGVHMSTETDATNLVSPNRHAECMDCHNPHYVQAKTPKVVGSNDIAETQLGAWGVKPDYTGAPAMNPPTSYLKVTFVSDLPLGADDKEPYLCLKCHSSYAPSPTLADISPLLNPANSSTHPLLTPGGNPYCTSTVTNGNITTMEAPFNQAGDHNTIMCSNCHGSDTAPPDGPHGSGQNRVLRASLVAVQYGAYGNNWGTPLCLLCHKGSVYLDQVAGSRYDKHPGAQGNHGRAPTDTGSGGYGGCLVCHGTADTADNIDPVSFHGLNDTWAAQPGGGKTPATAASPAFRFLNNRTNFTGWEPGSCAVDGAKGVACNTGHGSAY